MAFVENNPTDFEFKKEGDFLVGNLIAVQKDVGINKSKVYNIGTHDRVVNVWGSTVLDAKMTGIKVGSLIKIVYDGLGIKKPGKQPPKLFRVFVDDGKEEESEKKEVEAVAQ